MSSVRRLTVYVPKSKDSEQDYSSGIPPPSSPLHAPINYHAYAASTQGLFTSNFDKCICSGHVILLLLTHRLEFCFEQLQKLKKQKQIVLIGFKETGFFQISEILSKPSNLKILYSVLEIADGALAPTEFCFEFFRSTIGLSKRRFVFFVPTPYPVDLPDWNFSKSWGQRHGIFIGTREFDNPTRNHLLALLWVRNIVLETKQKITLINSDGLRGFRLINALSLPKELINVVPRTTSYASFLQLLNSHRVVLQWDQSLVPGQIAGDCLLARMPCLGGNGTIEALSHNKVGAEFDMPHFELALDLLSQKETWTKFVSKLEAHSGLLSFATTRKKLEEMIEVLVSTHSD